MLRLFLHAKPRRRKEEKKKREDSIRLESSAGCELEHESSLYFGDGKLCVFAPWREPSSFHLFSSECRSSFCTQSREDAKKRRRKEKIVFGWNHLLVANQITNHHYTLAMENFASLRLGESHHLFTSIHLNAVSLFARKAAKTQRREEEK
jgi:hypothetical protein